MHEAMEGGTGIYRDEKSLTDTCQKIAELRERFKSVRIDDHTNSFNTDLTTALEMGFMLDVAEAIAHSALERKESRGSHQRLDFTKRDDDNYLKHSLAFCQDGDAPPRIDYKPVTITKWPPADRVYGKQ